MKRIELRHYDDFILKERLWSPWFIQQYFSALKPFKSSRCIKASFHILENRLNCPTTRAFRTKISMKLVYQYMAIFYNFQPTSRHFHPLQVENCDSNSRLVVDEDDNGKFRPERVKVKMLAKIESILKLICKVNEMNGILGHLVHI